MEDTPYELDLEKGISPTSNVRLCEIAAQELIRHGAKIETDKHAVGARLGILNISPDAPQQTCLLGSGL
jgi:hypothetical protein